MAKRSVLFRDSLLKWNDTENSREMPWKAEKDPYRIWISEIILQQTRVEQGLAYYQRFIEKYPDVKKLAAAPDNEIFKMWEGLGYYSRCKNLIYSARIITKELKGQFPLRYEDILQLKGVGSYTASAIASFAYNFPYAVVDGNVFRVLSRYFGSRIPVDNAAGKKFYTELANDLLDKKQPGIYNQAIMDFGATVCKPLPLCPECPMNKSCIAYKQGITKLLPVKEKTVIKKNRWMYYVVAELGDRLYVRKRTEKDIWQNLHEFILLESGKPLSDKMIFEMIRVHLKTNNYSLKSISGLYSQKLTHQDISGRFIRISLNSPVQLTDYNLISSDQLKKLAFPKYITAYLTKN